MKVYTLSILITCLISSCIFPVNEEDFYSDLPEPSIDSTMRVGDYLFTSRVIDSSYVDFWCSLEIVENTNENIENLDLTLVAYFLATFHNSCNDNNKYSENANRLLFDVCKKKPDLVHQIISKNTSLDRIEILKQLESPITEKIDLDIIKKGFEKIVPLEYENYEKWKLNLISALETAEQKTNSKR